MGRKRGRKRWMVFVLAGILALPAAGPAGEARAASPETKAGSYTKNGTYHIDQFGEYDIGADVTVTDGKITDVEIGGSNFGGTYAEMNKGKLQTAIDGMVEKFFGMADDDAEGIRELDAVTGATYSSNGIKEAVADALGLELAEESSGGVPEKAPDPGTYEVTVAVRSDVVDHSLVQTDTATALLTVGEDGQMRLSYTMVSGTEQEPMYILGFNGYYEENDPANELSMKGVTFSTEQRGDYTVVTDVTVPLAGLSQYYYNNTRIYVPAMSNLNGEINGIYFENGQFSVKTTVTMYWDTLKKHDEEDAGQQSMEVTASVSEQTSEPSGVIQIPSSLSMGQLKTASDNVQSYEVRVSAGDQDGTVTVSATAGGMLYSGKNKLAFSNDFGTQTARGNETVKVVDAETEAVLYGNITIKGADVEAADPGNYTGTTTFTITYGSGADNPGGDEKPENPEPDIHNLKDGTYSITGKIVKADQSTLSMADNAINHTIKLTVKGGEYFITLDMKGMNISGMTGYLGKLQYFLTGYTRDQYGCPQGKLGDAVVKSYQMNENGERIKDKFGTDYPDQVVIPLIPEALEDGFVPLQVFVPVMESISAGLGDQQVYLALDLTTLKETGEDDPAFTDDNAPGNNNNGSGGGLTGGSGLAGGSLPGGGSLKGSLPGSSRLKAASNVKTDDTSANTGLWIAVLAAGFLCLGAGAAKAVRSGSKKRQSGEQRRDNV